MFVREDQASFCCKRRKRESKRVSPSAQQSIEKLMKVEMSLRMWEAITCRGCNKGCTEPTGAMTYKKRRLSADHLMVGETGGKRRDPNYSTRNGLHQLVGETNADGIRTTAVVLQVQAKNGMQWRSSSRTRQATGDAATVVRRGTSQSSCFRSAKRAWIFDCWNAW